MQLEKEILKYINDNNNEEWVDILPFLKTKFSDPSKSQLKQINSAISYLCKIRDTRRNLINAKDEKYSLLGGQGLSDENPIFNFGYLLDLSCKITIEGKEQIDRWSFES